MPRTVGGKGLAGLPLRCHVVLPGPPTGTNVAVCECGSHGVRITSIDLGGFSTARRLVRALNDTLGIDAAAEHEMLVGCLRGWNRAAAGPGFMPAKYLSFINVERHGQDGNVGSRTAPQREVERAKVLLAYSDGQAPTAIQRALGVSRPTIYKCIDKALAAGVATGLHDRYHRPYAPQISEAAKVWVINLACCKPKDLGLAADLWTLSALAEHVAANAAKAGFECGGPTSQDISEPNLGKRPIFLAADRRCPGFDLVGVRIPFSVGPCQAAGGPLDHACIHA